MIIHSTMTIAVEGPRLPRGVCRMCLGGTMTGAVIVVSTELRSTKGNRALTRDLSSFKAWSTGIEHIEKTLAEIIQMAADYMFQAQNVSVGPSEQR